MQKQALGSCYKAEKEVIFAFLTFAFGLHLCVYLNLGSMLIIMLTKFLQVHENYHSKCAFLLPVCSHNNATQRGRIFVCFMGVTSEQVSSVHQSRYQTCTDLFTFIVGPPLIKPCHQSRFQTYRSICVMVWLRHHLLFICNVQSLTYYYAYDTQNSNQMNGSIVNIRSSQSKYTLRHIELESNEWKHSKHTIIVV